MSVAAGYHHLKWNLHVAERLAVGPKPACTVWLILCCLLRNQPWFNEQQSFSFQRQHKEGPSNILKYAQSLGIALICTRNFATLNFGQKSGQPVFFLHHPTFQFVARSLSEKIAISFAIWYSVHFSNIRISLHYFYMFYSILYDNHVCVLPRFDHLISCLCLYSSVPPF
jgi:hypothetical protein